MDLHQALQDMSIADDKPIILSNHSKYCSIERNQCSLMGRFLNPTQQRMANWILDMPRIWRLYSRVRGIALSQESFQFIFNSEADLDEILKSGVWTQDDWCVVMEKWIEKPPDDYLMFLPVWVRVRNIPVNYYTEETIREVSSKVGKVLLVLFDPEKSQAQDYVRVRILLDVRNPLRNSKEVQLPTGEIVAITFDYERIRKRCFHCQRLTHEKNLCPFQQPSLVADHSEVSQDKNKKKGLLISDGDNLISKRENPKVLADAMKSLSSSQMVEFSKPLKDDVFSDFSNLNFSTGLKANMSEAGSSGLSAKQKNPKKRKVSLLKQSKSKAARANGDQTNMEDYSATFDKVIKRRTVITKPDSSDCLKEDKNTVVPSEPPLDQMFKDMLNNCGMHELGSTGNDFTWGGSDHRPVLVKFINDQEVFRGQFRFDKRMADDPSLAKPRVTDTMNQQLTKAVTEQEIYNAVFSINGESAPGPDGFTALFFQKYWSVVKLQIIEEIQGFFNSGVLPEEWNHTHLCLISKVLKPQRMTDMRPISLCSVLYKIISKIISSRLKVYLPEIVSPTQSAYVAERLVSDNILIAHEIMHSLHSHPGISTEFLAFKTDMSKAYDRVEWSFLEEILIALGFDKKWNSWIMGCVSSVSYSVLINGQPFGYIKPERGIRQGDPLSPLLFVLCTEALIHFLNQASREGKAAGIQFNNAGPFINHLLFADDTLLVCKANKEECEAMLNCLSKYERVSGQMINLEKSAITFGAKVNQDMKEWIKCRSGIHLEGGAGRYLGLPDCLSGSKQQLFGFIREKLKDRMSGWYAKTLSQGGKEILLKSIAMAFPVYAMTCFKLPISLCKNLTSVMMDYWWNNMQNTRKIHWVSWQKLAMPKSLGGIGFKDLQCFNQALLAKQAWRLLNEKDSLFSQIFKSRYFLNSDFLNAPHGTRPSYAWRSILYGRELLVQGLKTVIGNGEATNVWIDKWVFDGKSRRAQSLHTLTDISMKVKSLIDPYTRNWKWNRLKELFPPKEIQIISKQRPLPSRIDSFCWSGNNNGIYSVKSGYELSSRKAHPSLFKDAELNPSISPLLDSIWKIQTAPKIKVFIWKALKGAIAVEDRLRTRGIHNKDGCLMCEEEIETVNHILFQCPLARQVWAVANVPFPVSGFGDSIFANISHLLQLSQMNTIPQDLRFVNSWILWILWKNRNKLLFEGEGSQVTKIVAKALDDGKQWLLAQNKGKQIEKLHREQSSDWIPPLNGDLKCNIGFAWSKKKALAGASWIVRNSVGNVLLHSRRSYSQVHSLFDAKIKSWEWALDSMNKHHLENVTFGASTSDIIQALSKPKDWPAIVGHIAELLSHTKDKPFWFILMEPSRCNRGAMKIANSVITGLRLQSYVAKSHPRWLSDFFHSESSSQISERSFPSPISHSPPPRVAAPLLNPSEIAVNLESIQRLAVPLPQQATGRIIQSSSRYNDAQTVEDEATSRYKSKFEVGESSRCPKVDSDKESEEKKKRKFQEYQFGGIQMPPKKR
ncbi:Reverse transcriptase domain [Arabidopsis thaliana x Arabidopsis arenosa]|uniref:Reverse transcriptase domain n=1 Tax=Arabidopsis thaliana x Arabidopsis arenosa TaxID=1240361 RepID=A0A8T1YSC2_9BRAS|nr:Reverse transcriptase domain [Arabidopsis thaliana x Arabidopsis arenosa]KAG7593188.1 Reverse transcriptase domain [Arabidopsis thaliana x Arabidopsis arenosa]